jgi:hypothetical protein
MKLFTLFLKTGILTKKETLATSFLRNQERNTQQFYNIFAHC